jgi:UrcA family protein
MKTLIGLGLAAVIGGAAVSGPAILVIHESARLQRVSYADLDLGTIEGRLALYGRIRAAARNVCSQDGERSAEALASADSCYAAAIAKARDQVGSPGMSNRDLALNSAVITVRGE